MRLLFKDVRNGKAVYLLPFVSSTVFGLAMFFYGSTLGFMSSDFIRSEDYIDPGNTPQNLYSRVLWGISAIGLMVTLVWTLTLAFLTSVKYLKRVSKEGRNWSIAFILGLSIALLILHFKFGIGSGGKTADGLLSIIEKNKIPIRYLTEITNTLTVLSIVLIVFSACILLHPDPLSEKNPIHSLLEKSRDGRILLYSSTVLLIVGVIEIYFLHHWPEGLVKNEAVANIRFAANTLTITAGFIFSFLLVVIFLPVSLIHKNWATKIYHLNNPESNVPEKKWLGKIGLDSSIWNEIIKYVAFVSPFAVAIMAKKFGIDIGK